QTLHATSFAQGVETAARRRFRATLRAAKRDGLARDDAQLRVPTNHGDRVHDPSHRLVVGIDVGRGDVAVWPDDGRDLESVAARETFEFVHGHGLRIADHAALAAAVRDADGRAFPSHPRRERLDLVERDARMKADAAFGWPARDVVLHAIALEDLHVAAVHLHGDRDDQLALRVLQDLPRGFV